MRDSLLSSFRYGPFCDNKAANRLTARLCAAALLGLALVACSGTPSPYGAVEGERFGKGELLQSDTNRMVTLAMQQVLTGRPAARGMTPTKHRVCGPIDLHCGAWL